MKKQIWVILSCVTVVFSCFADIPDWVKNQGRSARFPDELYLTGFGMAKLTDKDMANCQKLSQDNAKANLGTEGPRNDSEHSPLTGRRKIRHLRRIFQFGGPKQFYVKSTRS